MHYSLTLRHPHYHNKKFPIALLHFTAGFLLLIVWFESNVQTVIPWLGYILLIIGLLGWFYTFIAFKMLHRHPKINEIVRIITCCAFLFYAFFFFYWGENLFGAFILVISLVFFMVYWVEKKWSKPFVIRIDAEGVLFPGTFKSPLIPWQNFNHVILKDSILTLDLTSNRIIQLEIRRIEEDDQVRKINAFCSEKILRYQ